MRMRNEDEDGDGVMDDRDEVTASAQRCYARPHCHLRVMVKYVIVDIMIVM